MRSAINYMKLREGTKMSFVISQCAISSVQRNLVFATKSNFLIPISFQPGGVKSVNLWYFKLRLSDLKDFGV